MEKIKKKKSTVAEKILNVITVIICVLVLFVAIIAIGKQKNQYNNIFGYTLLNVTSDSMKGDKKDSFEKGDLVVGKIIQGKTDELAKLKAKSDGYEGDIITFFAMKDGERVLNTHRVVGINYELDKKTIKSFRTKGDATDQETELVFINEVVAKYVRHHNNMGGFFGFFGSKTGFLILIVVPSVLALAYCVFLFVKNLKGYNSLKKQEANELDKEAMKEAMRIELLEEMARQKVNENGDNEGDKDPDTEK